MQKVAPASHLANRVSKLREIRRGSLSSHPARDIADPSQSARQSETHPTPPANPTQHPWSACQCDAPGWSAANRPPAAFTDRLVLCARCGNGEKGPSKRLKT